MQIARTKRLKNDEEGIQKRKGAAAGGSAPRTPRSLSLWQSPAEQGVTLLHACRRDPCVVTATVSPGRLLRTTLPVTAHALNSGGCGGQSPLRLRLLFQARPLSSAVGRAATTRR